MPKRKTRRARQTNPPNYVVYKNEITQGETYRHQREAVLAALALHDEDPTALVQVSGYSARGVYFFQQFQATANEKE